MAGITTSIADESFYSDRHSTYVVNFGNAVIRTTLTSDSGVVTNWLHRVNNSIGLFSRRIVGLDIEWRPHSRQYTNPAATLQICVGNRCLIFQLLHADRIPSSLTDFMSNRNNVFVGVGIESDLRMLQSDHNFGFGVNFKDLRTLAAERYTTRDLRQSGLKRLVDVVLHVDLEKPPSITTSRWDRERLSHAQIKYAAIDAYACFRIGTVLRATST
ncbi:hypothetical protein M569_11733 [Genlisea aurea]|uniref:3'-5' exonuclease domain-containing protein n=1 Tax=Genlisea aurea TaxID=192259 RepID=S8DJK5_9LAMI|nr:hypothetical protein M569_11733 [Genlisea aurea]